jgi:alkylation response protein AidB-like acyl-CoA dehydrogenase
MTRYRAPVPDWQFLLHDVLRIDQHTALPGFADLTPEFTNEVLEAAARFHVEVLHPLNAPGDAEGARIDADGQVHTPTGFIAAWQAYREAGWHRLSLDEALGGAGLPPLMSVPVNELRVSTGHAFSMYSSFCAPTARMLAVLGEPWMRQHIVPRLAAGDWTATMCMTEPQAGTDLRQLRTRAEVQPDGSWRLHGHKCFISGGDHDLTENIVHVVLAKVPDAAGRLPPGLGAVHVFLVPKVLIDPVTGALGERNAVRARGIEHKMGIEGSATCTLDFDGARGWCITDERRSGSAASMAPMFLLMNYARVGTAISGVGYAELAGQNAADYARERLSGRASGGARHPEQPADPIIVHPDVRRLLLDARAFAEGARAGAMQAALWQSLAEHHADPAERERAGDLLDLLVPVMKAFFTDRGFDAAVACQQVLGGHGYIRDHGLEQIVRNARIGQLYEGANGIQGVDLLHRKLAAHGGRAGRRFLQAVAEATARHHDTPAVATLCGPLDAARARLATTLDWVRQTVTEQPATAEAGAYDLLTAIGIVYLGWMWLEMAAAAAPGRPCRCADDALRLRKSQLARAWLQRQLPLVDGLCTRIESGNDSLLALADEAV